MDIFGIFSQYSTVLRLLGVGLLFVFIIILFLGKRIKAISAGKKGRHLTAAQKEGEVAAAIAAAINEYRKYYYVQPVFITAQKADDNVIAAIAAAINEYRK